MMSAIAIHRRLLHQPAFSGFRNPVSLESIMPMIVSKSTALQMKFPAWPTISSPFNPSTIYAAKNPPVAEAGFSYCSDIPAPLWPGIRMEMDTIDVKREFFYFPFLFLLVVM
ncbi:hypothetical protein OIU77_007390 [Salix suchowensis]|uniref:Uncharacterized protein n=1 Tax=Salix suchowensis TaxID=1278906 RepID=A0ABQ9AGV5_9ROSI|nr:hypothetical protein OIU77_007390 [Salix suchowensis]